MKLPLGTWIRILISVTAIILIPWLLRDKLHDAYLILRHGVQFPYLVMAAFFYFLSLLSTATRMHFILKAKQIIWGFFDTLYVSAMGIFFSLFLPSAIGGDVVKAVYLARHAKNKADVFSCIVIDRFSGFCIVLGLAFLSSVILREPWNPIPIWMSYTALAVMAVVGIAIWIRPEWIPFVFSKMRFLPHVLQEKVNRFYDSLSGFFHNRPLLIGNFFFSFCAQSFFIVAYYFIGKSLDAPIPFPLFFIMVPMITIISMAPSINGLGVREAGALFLFKLYMPAERALAMTVLIGALIYFFGFLGGVWYLIRGVWGGDSIRLPARQDS